MGEQKPWKRSAGLCNPPAKANTCMRNCIFHHPSKEKADESSGCHNVALAARQTQLPVSPVYFLLHGRVGIRDGNSTAASLKDSGLSPSPSLWTNNTRQVVLLREAAGQALISLKNQPSNLDSDPSHHAGIPFAHLLNLKICS